MHLYPGLPERGCYQILTDQLTLSQPGGQIITTTFTTCSSPLPPVEFSDLPTALQKINLCLKNGPFPHALTLISEECGWIHPSIQYKIDSREVGVGGKVLEEEVVASLSTCLSIGKMLL